MNTPSHFLITASLGRSLPKLNMAKGALWLGSIAPDIPLWVLSVGGWLYYRYILAWSPEATARYLFDDLYFHNPWWIISHNALHAPLVILAGLALTWRGRQLSTASPSQSRAVYWWFWFFCACLLHSAIDILTHVDDGPLIGFPLDWQTRFHSPVSYWDHRYYGQEFQLFELLLNGLCLIYLLFPAGKGWLRRTFQRKR